MTALHWLLGLVIGFETPVPIYWLVLHGPISFWRRHARASYLVAVIVAWGGGDWLLYHFRRQLFPWDQMPPWGWRLAAGLALVAFDLFTFIRVEFELGGSRLVGHAEMTGGGELATCGLYTRIRHPRYLGMIACVLGVCLLLNSKALWIAGFVWLVVALGTIALEERELRVRFGPAYVAYAQRVPALLPFRLGAHRS